MAANDKSLANEAKYVKLNMYPKRRAFIILICSLLTFFCSSWIWINLTQKRADHWFIISLPMIFVGLLTNFLAPAEEWKYGPWQESSQKYEKNIYD
jgi:hypothetical protein